MASGAEWVEDVRRWCRAGAHAVASLHAPAQDGNETESAALGYEAAHPALQSRNWPEASDSFEPLR